MTVETLEERLIALETEKLPERNSEGYGYIIACVCATALLYFGIIPAMWWAIVVLGDTVAYGLGRIIKKTREI